MKASYCRLGVGLLLWALTAVCPVYAQYQMENLNRGVVAVSIGSGGVYVGWRDLGTDSTNVAFNVYRNSTLVNANPITNSTNVIDTNGSTSAQYSVRPVINGVEQDSSSGAACRGMMALISARLSFYKFFHDEGSS